MATTMGWFGRLGFATVVAVVALGVFVAPASAHNDEIGSTPEAGAVVTQQPEEISVTTSDDLLSLDGLGGGMGIQVAGPAGAEPPLFYGDGCVTVDGPSIETKAKLGQPGEYTVTWQVVSVDGHSVSDSFTFTWKPDSEQQLATGASKAPTCGSTAADESTEEAATAAPGDTAATGDAATVDDTATTNAALTAVFWIAGAVLVVLIAVVVTLVLVRRKPNVSGE